ncbi:MAG: 1-deoxy-D-xylulose-5-phosphate reductoisomerase [Candidatus Dasytiphilus stammeri]
MKRLTILGSTGSVGTTTLHIVDENPHLFTVQALVAGYNVDLMIEQCYKYQPVWAAMFDKSSAKRLHNSLQSLNLPTKVLAGEQAACELATLDEVDQVMAAIVGTAGLLPTIAAIRAGKKVLLANKEALVICGNLFMEAVCNAKAQLLPVDSEHNAIFQSLPTTIQQHLGYASLIDNGVKSIIITGSGGPFLNIPLSNLEHVTPEQACNHPNWKMGRKISVDSATLMNKGLEYIEAHWLFNATVMQIEVLIHPQSVIHSMVRYLDGSVLAQLGLPDMKIPIAHAMAWPKRLINKVNQIDFKQFNHLTFQEPNLERYPCLKLAIDCCKKGLVATITLNAANEIAVNAFLNFKISFPAIPAITIAALESFSCQEPQSVEEVILIDRLARIHIAELLNSYL